MIREKAERKRETDRLRQTRIESGDKRKSREKKRQTRIKGSDQREKYRQTD